MQSAIVKQRYLSEETSTSNIDFAEYKKVFEECFQKCILVFTNDNSDERNHETTDLLDIFGDMKANIDISQVRQTLNEKEKTSLTLMFQLIGNLGYCYSEEGDYDRAKLHFDAGQADDWTMFEPKSCCTVSQNLLFLHCLHQRLKTLFLGHQRPILIWHLGYRQYQ